MTGPVRVLWQGGGAMTPNADPTLFDRLCDIIHTQQVAEWQGGIHPEDVGHLARALIRAGVTMPAPPECRHVDSQRMIGRKVYPLRYCRDCRVECSEKSPCPGCRSPKPPAVCGASTLIDGIEYVCDQPTHRPGTVHQCTDGIGVMVWRDGDDGPEVVAAWTHEVDG